MENSLIILLLRKVILFFAGLVVYLLVFGYILPEYIIAGMPENDKAVGLSILTNAAYIAYFLSFFTYVFLPLKLQPQKIWRKLLLFFLVYVAFWFAYIYFV